MQERCRGCSYYLEGANLCMLLGAEVGAGRPCPLERRTCLSCQLYLRSERRCALTGRLVANPARPPCLAREVAVPSARRPAPELFDAVRRGDYEAVRRLLAQGADPNLRDERGFTPLHIASAKGLVDVAELLLMSGADPNAAGEAGVTPLHLAVLNGNADLVLLLLEHGADPAARDVGGKTPRDLASETGRHDLAQLLESYEGGRRGSMGS